MALILGLTAASARADVSDSGNLTIGGQAVIAGSMTVTGPIAGSSVTLSTTGTAAYALTTSTGIHVLNGRVKLESGSYIEWPDGTKSTTSAAGSGGAGAAAASTFTILSSETSANDTLTEVTGASITLTCAGDVGVEVVFEGSEAHSGSGGGTLKWVFMDDAYISNLCLNAACSSTRPAPWSSSVSMGGLGRDPGASSTAVFPFTIITPPFPCSAGSHNFKVKFKRTGGGTSYIACAPSGGTFTSAPCVFIVREVRR